MIRKRYAQDSRRQAIGSSLPQNHHFLFVNLDKEWLVFTKTKKNHHHVLQAH
jgi:hypothetical protein